MVAAFQKIIDFRAGLCGALHSSERAPWDGRLGRPEQYTSDQILDIDGCSCHWCPLLYGEENPGAALVRSQTALEL